MRRSCWPPPGTRRSRSVQPIGVEDVIHFIDPSGALVETATHDSSTQKGWLSM